MVAGMTCEQFWNSSLGEIDMAVRAYNRRRKDDTRIAFAAARHVMSAWLGNKVPSLNRMMGATSIRGMSPDEVKARYGKQARK